MRAAPPRSATARCASGVQARAGIAPESEAWAEAASRACGVSHWPRVAAETTSTRHQEVGWQERRGRRAADTVSKDVSHAFRVRSAKSGLRPGPSGVQVLPASNLDSVLPAEGSDRSAGALHPRLRMLRRDAGLDQNQTGNTSGRMSTATREQPGKQTVPPVGMLIAVFCVVSVLISSVIGHQRSSTCPASCVFGFKKPHLPNWALPWGWAIAVCVIVLLVGIAFDRFRRAWAAA